MKKQRKKFLQNARPLLLKDKRSKENDQKAKKVKPILKFQKEQQKKKKWLPWLLGLLGVPLAIGTVAWGIYHELI